MGRLLIGSASAARLGALVSLFFGVACGGTTPPPEQPAAGAETAPEDADRALAEMYPTQQSEVSGTIVVRIDRKSTRLNSSHVRISYAVFCLKKKKKNIT